MFDDERFHRIVCQLKSALKVYKHKEACVALRSLEAGLETIGPNIKTITKVEYLTKLFSIYMVVENFIFCDFPQIKITLPPEIVGNVKEIFSILLKDINIYYWSIRAFADKSVLLSHRIPVILSEDEIAMVESVSVSSIPTLREGRDSMQLQNFDRLLQGLSPYPMLEKSYDDFVKNRYVQKYLFINQYNTGRNTTVDLLIHLNSFLTKKKEERIDGVIFAALLELKRCFKVMFHIKTFGDVKYSASPCYTLVDFLRAEVIKFYFRILLPFLRTGQLFEEAMLILEKSDFSRIIARPSTHEEY